MELFEIGLIVTVETEIVAVVTSMCHREVGMFLRDKKIVFVIKPKGRRFIALMAGVTIEIRQVSFRANQFGIRNPDSRITGN